MWVRFLHWVHLFFPWGAGAGFWAGGCNTDICLLSERTLNMLEGGFAIDTTRFAEILQCFGKGTGHAVHDDVVSALESLSVF